MKNTMQEYLHKFQKEHKHFCRYASVVGVLALITVLIVNWQLHRTGVAMSGDADYVCGLEEHEHSLKEGCYEVNEADLICGFTEGQIIDAAAAAAYDAANGKDTSGAAQSASSAGTSGITDSSTSGSSASDNSSASGSNTNNSGNTSSADSNTGSSDNSGNTGTDSSNASRIEELNKQITELENQEIPMQKEHHHTDACYEEKTVETEPAKTETEITCGKSEHTHGDECYTQEEGSEEKTLTCGQEEHRHDDSCKTEKTIEAQTTTEKTLICGYEEGQMVPMSEEEIQQAKDEKAKKLEELRAQLAEAEAASQQAAQATQLADNNTSVENSSAVDSAATTENNSSAESTSSAESGEAAGSANTNTNTENAGTGSNAGASTETDSNTASGSNETANANASTSGSGATTAKTENASSADTVNDGRHHHTIDCYSTYKLVCEKTEHKHTSACLIDKNADVETAADWEKTIPSLSGDRAADLISVARSQLGYTESTRNYDEESHRGYTRYGEWYGNPYGDWGTFFTAFCLHYAQITDVPTNSGVQAWISNVQSADLWWDASESNCVKAGDLVFFNDGNDHMGIVSSISGSTISVIEGNRPNGDGPDSVQENSYDTSDGNIAGYCELPVENHDNEISIMDDELGLDISSYITSVTLKKKDGIDWVETTEFSTADQVQADFIFANLSKAQVQNNSYICSVPLSTNISCSGMTGGIILDGDTEAGTYRYLQKDGKWYVVLELDKTYVDGSGDQLHGTVGFKFWWNVTIDDNKGKQETWQIGDKTGTVTITKDKTEGNSLQFWKEASDIAVDDQGYAYIDYTLKLRIQSDGYQGPIDISDVLTATGFGYDTSSAKITGTEISDSTHGDVTVTMKDCTATETGAKVTFQIKSNASDGKISKGLYSITYRVKTTQKYGSDANISKSVKNEASVKDGDDEKKDSKEKWFSTKTVEKNGKVSTEDGQVYVDYTVTINKGTPVVNLEEETKFTDTIPDKLELVKDSIIIKQYDQNGKEQSNSIQFNYDDTSKVLSGTLPTGRYYYVITYRTKVSDVSSLPLTGEKVKNTAKTTGGVDGESTTENLVKRDDLLVKKYTSQAFSKDDNGNDTVLLNWESTINVTDIKANDTYDDWCDATTVNGENKPKMEMTDAQIQGVELYDASGNKITDGYTVNRLDHTENGVNLGLFRIKFTAAKTGPITIKYQTTGILSYWSVGSYPTFQNCCSFGDLNANASAQVRYVTEDKDVIWKSNDEWNRNDSGTTTQKINPGDKTLTWYVKVNGQGANVTTGTLKGDLLITDNIADGMEFLPDTLTIYLGQYQHGTNIKDQVIWSYNNGVLSIEVPSSVYENATYKNIVIRYQTKIPDSFFSGSDAEKNFSNTATVKWNGGSGSSSYSQKVTRDLVLKDGDYDENKNTLTYRITLNPDGSVLNSGKPLKVEDTIKISNDTINSHIKLESLALYTATLVTGTDGKSAYKAGQLIMNMTADEMAPTETGHYYFNSTTNTFEAIIPDGQACVLLAKYFIDYKFAGTIDISNSVKLHGANDWSNSNELKNKEYKGYATIRSDKDTVTVIKRDKDYGETLLDGAEFELKKYDESTKTWVDPTVTTVTEDGTTSTSTENAALITKNGNASATIQRKVLYRMRETKAPTGFVLDSTPQYFVAYAEGDTYTLPESIAGDESYNKSKVTAYKLTPLTETQGTDGTKTTTGYGNIEISFYDQRDRTIVQKGQLSITKSWKDSNGNTLESYTDLARMSPINVTLTKYTPDMAKVTVKGNSGTYELEVPKSQNTSVTLSGQCNSTTGGSTSFDQATQKTTVSGITDDTTIIMNCDVTDWYVTNCITTTVADGASLDKPNATVISTEVLNNDNHWYHLWENLDTDSYVAYTLTEETVEGYKATYQLNKKDLEEGTKFSLGTEGDFITITNSPDSKLYTLPKTGGSGVMPIYVTGGILTAGAAGLWVTRKSRKKEQ